MKKDEGPGPLNTHGGGEGGETHRDGNQTSPSWAEEYDASKRRYHELTDAMARSRMRLIIASKAVRELRGKVENFNKGCIDSIFDMYKKKNVQPQFVRRAPYDPAGLFQCYPSLKLRKGYCLDSYYMTGSAGIEQGFVFVLPEGRQLPQPDEGEQDLKLMVYLTTGSVDRGNPLPPWARYDVEAFLEGDGTPSSFYLASMFARDIRRLCASWHCLYDGIEQAAPSTDEPAKEGLTSWYESPPDSWLPVVWKDEEQLWNVSFYSYYTDDDEPIAYVKFNNDTYLRGYEFGRFDFMIGRVGLSR